MLISRYSENSISSFCPCNIVCVPLSMGERYLPTRTNILHTIIFSRLILILPQVCRPRGRLSPRLFQ